jgi:YD repeat-containing protein
MKAITLIGFLLGNIACFAQPSQQEIKKHHIRKAIEKRIDDGGTAEKLWYYDRKGLDSAVTMYGETSSYTYTWLRNGKVDTKTLVKKDGKKDTYTYQYQPDGSYKETMTDGSFGMKSFEWYDKKGNIIKSQSPDGNTTTYKYDAKGRLITVVSDGHNQGVKINNKYSYNAKGQLIKMERNADGNKSTITYQYNAKGVLIKDISKGEWEGEKFETISEHEYNEKGLLKKTVAKSASVVTTYEYEYEYY